MAEQVAVLTEALRKVTEAYRALYPELPSDEYPPSLREALEVLTAPQPAVEAHDAQRMAIACQVLKDAADDYNEQPKITGDVVVWLRARAAAIEERQVHPSNAPAFPGNDYE